MDRCFECHVPTQKSSDHTEICSVKQWFVSKAIGKYVKIPSVRWIITFQSPINIFLNGRVQAAQSGTKLFSAISDSYFHFETAKKLVLMTTTYTRIRIPIVIQTDQNSAVEKLVLLTSSDWAVVCARGSRKIVENNFVGDFEHNTPLSLYMLESPFDLAITVYSAGGRVDSSQILYQSDEKKFAIPNELDVKTPQSPIMSFDAALPMKMKRK